MFSPSSLSRVSETVKEDGQEEAGDFGAFGVLPMYIQPTLSSRKRAASAASNVSVSSYAQAILDHHNNHRANHSTLALTWSNDLAYIGRDIGGSFAYILTILNPVEAGMARTSAPV